MGGTKAIGFTPLVGTPRREYAELFIPGEEALEDGELRVTVLGSGNPWNTRAQASASVLAEVGNPECDLLLFVIGSVKPAVETAIQTISKKPRSCL